MIKKIMLLLLFVLIAVILLVGFVLLIIIIKRTIKVSDEIYYPLISQTISGILISLVSFFSAYGLWRIQDSKKQATEKQKNLDIQIDSFIRIANEVSENRLRLGLDKKNNIFVRIPLKTAAWEQGKYQTPIKTPLLIDSLKLLYDDIEKYNLHVGFIQYKVMIDKLTKEQIPNIAKNSQANIDQELYSKLEELENLISRELVTIGKKDRKEHTDRFGEWKENVEISYFRQEKINEKK